MRIAVCSGSFDPITLGHMDIIRRTAACFDQVYVCVSPNAEKRGQMFTPEQKLKLVEAAVLELWKTGLLVGDGINFDPLGNATRAQAATLCMRIHQTVKVWYKSRAYLRLLSRNKHSTPVNQHNRL